jgi:hypothetical protein
VIAVQFVGEKHSFFGCILTSFLCLTFVDFGVNGFISLASFEEVPNINHDLIIYGAKGYYILSLPRFPFRGIYRGN